MKNILLSEAKAHLGRYVKEAQNGKGFIISDRNKPVARLIGLEKSVEVRKLRLGRLAGTFKVPEDFTALLREFEDDFYS